MKQGYSGSTVGRKGNLVEKVSSDTTFVSSKERQRDLIALSQKLAVLPGIDHIDGRAIYMKYVEGQEGLTEGNARRAGTALRLLHEQRAYPHPCMTGLEWLIRMANANLARIHHGFTIPADLRAKFPVDALIHSEPVQFIEKEDGTLVFIDIEGIGMGTRYQDLGFVYYAAMKEEKPAIFKSFMEGYQAEAIPIDQWRIRQLAGIISLAYAAFADFEKRMELGLRLVGQTGLDSHQVDL